MNRSPPIHLIQYNIAGVNYLLKLTEAIVIHNCNSSNKGKRYSFATIWCIITPQHSLLQDLLFTTGFNGKISSLTPRFISWSFQVLFGPSRYWIESSICDNLKHQKRCFDILFFLECMPVEIAREITQMDFCGNNSTAYLLQSDIPTFVMFSVNIHSALPIYRNQGIWGPPLSEALSAWKSHRMKNFYKHFLLLYIFVCVYGK